MLKKIRKRPTRLLRKQSATTPRDGPRLTAQDEDQYSVLPAYDSAINKRLQDLKSSSKLSLDSVCEDKHVYKLARELVQNREAALSFDYLCKSRATEVEKKADRILQDVKERDKKHIYAAAKKRRGYGGQLHPRFFGDHFLSNAGLIEKTSLFEMARQMPKGAHLHIHFNANLLPNVLIDIAKGMDHMYIWSDVPLMNQDGDSSGFHGCKLQFSIKSTADIRALLKGRTANLFDVAYIPGQPMRFKLFCAEFQSHYNKAHGKVENDRSIDVDRWLRNKLVFQEEEAYNLLQTADGAWEQFNGRTKMMKGLFNYVTAYKEYTTQCLQEFVDDNIQYAEIRPNFMSTNQVLTDNGEGLMDNRDIMNLIIDQYEEFQRHHRSQVLKGLKIIYCAPRSFTKSQVTDSLAECLAFKRDSKFHDWIAGFDLVGEESKGKPLNVFIDEFLQFKKDCAEGKQPVEIPFLFHCGETLDIGTETDGNLFDALLLGSKRIGHGFALPRHPYVMEQMKARNVCVEVCPISNEILGLTPRMNGHAVYNLLANNVHCTVSTDNGTLFRSRLSHDFYQVMAGKPDMTLHGWRQLAEWSIEHSCLDEDKIQLLRQEWEKKWEEFCRWIVKAETRLTSAPEKELQIEDEDEIMHDADF